MWAARARKKKGDINRHFSAQTELTCGEIQTAAGIYGFDNVPVRDSAEICSDQDSDAIIVGCGRIER